MSGSTLEATKVLERDTLASFIVEQWDELNNQRAPWLAEKAELRNYVFATDTRKTTSGTLPWKNSTTIPKICQIRDNLHANYISALFPNDNAVQWEGYSREDETQRKKTAIQAYMSNKTREDNFRTTVSQLVLDYIDTGVAIADCVWVNETKYDEESGETIPGYVGPRAIRWSIHDVVFNPTARSFEDSWKITRSLKSFGELKMEYRDRKEEYIQKALARATDARSHLTAWTTDDHKKAEGYSVDGFGDMYTYLGSGYVEILEFTGTLHDPHTGDLLDDYVITVIDRNTVIRKEPIPAWRRNGYKVFTCWRKRPDNLYGMGPLDNLVGMQYRLDHLQNATADARDLTIMPPLKVRGELEEAVQWGPFARFQVGVDGDIAPLFTGANTAAMENEMMFLMNMMEEMAGAPKQAMGIRTPGEKTAHEINVLENAAGRIFQEKTTQFEIELLEPLLNNMLELAVRNMNGSDVLRVMDDDYGVADFLTITKEDITAAGKIRPIGARHFAQQAQLMQNLTGIANTALWQKIEPHFSDKATAKLVEELLQIGRFKLYQENSGVIDKIETQRIMQQGAEDLQTEAITPIE